MPADPSCPAREKITVGHAVSRFLERCGVRVAFGVISIHNMPMLDALHQRGRIRFVMARGEAGATNMADACARASGTLGVSITSTGTAAGNAAGAMVEALTAGTPLLHLTGQIESQYIDQNLACIHEAPDQLGMLQAVSKAALRVRSAQTALATVKKAVQIAQTAPAGPVSVEIPIDIQGALIDAAQDFQPLPVPVLRPQNAAIETLATALRPARRPLLWLGGGARAAGRAVERLLALGFGVVTSTQGRGIVPEDHPMSLGAYTLQGPMEAFYQSCDALLVVGSRLRGNETLKYQLKLPRPLLRIDADAAADGRGYASDAFACADATLALEQLADALEGRMQVDAAFAADLRAAHEAARAHVLEGLGPYKDLVPALQEALHAAAGRNFFWVRDVTLSNSTWGNRALRIFDPRAGVHALGGGIGQGLAMGIGAAMAAATDGAATHKTVALCGDGGFILNLGELACAVQEQAPLVILLMNDQRYGVIENIQDAHYGKRRCYTALHTPDYATLCAAMQVPHWRVNDLAQARAALDAALQTPGPALVEINMRAIGDFTRAFAGPPLKNNI